MIAARGSSAFNIVGFAVEKVGVSFCGLGELFAGAVVFFGGFLLWVCFRLVAVRLWCPFLVHFRKCCKLEGILH